jgi:hypothetical protein
MPYRERLNPWVLVRLLPNLQRVTVGQYRNRSDADGHLYRFRLGSYCMHKGRQSLGSNGGAIVYKSS